MSDELVKTDELMPKIDLAQWHGYSIEAERTAEAIIITDDVEDGMAVDYLSTIKKYQKETDGALHSTIDPWTELTDRVRDMFRPISDSFKTAEKTIKDKHGAYTAEKERIRREEERKRQEGHQRQILEEQRRVEGENRKRREEYEAKLQEERRKAEEENRQAAILAPPPVVEAQIIVPPPTVLPSAPTTKGNIGAATTTKSWDFEVVDIHAVYKAKPELVSLEIRRGLAKSIVQTNQNISGLRVFEVFNTRAKAAS